MLLLRILHRQAECRKKIFNDFNVNKGKLDDDEDYDNFWGRGLENNGIRRLWGPLEGRRKR